MGLFSIFRKPQVTAKYMDASEYISSPPRGVLPEADALPEDTSLPAGPSTRSKVLAGMLLDASNASEENEGIPEVYVPLEATSEAVYSAILDSDLPEENRAAIQLNVLYARDHEAWMRSLESDLEALAVQAPSSDFDNALLFRTEQLETRKKALNKSALGLETCGEMCLPLALELREKISAIDKALNK